MGCYLREAGYHHKFRRAYESFVPTTERQRSDQFRNTTQEFYKNLSRGQVDNKDFERYIYGGSYNKLVEDDRDKIETEMRQKLAIESRK